MAGCWGRRLRAVSVCAAVLSTGGLLIGCAAPSVTGAALGSIAVTSVGDSVGSGAAGGTTAPALPVCDNGDLPSMTPGMLTIATGGTPVAPWFVGDSPSSGQGLESAVAYALAQALGYGPDRVSWEVVDRAAAAAGAAKGFDLNFDQFTAPDKGTATADYSTGYFSVTDAVLVRKTVTPPTSLAAVEGLKLGVVLTPSAGQSVVESVNPSASAMAIPAAKTDFPGRAEALAGLTAGTVDGIVLPIPAALEAASADPNVALAGQLPADPSIQPVQLKVLLPKNSALTGCVSAAVDRLRVEGTLETLAAQWVNSLVPVLN